MKWCMNINNIAEATGGSIFNLTGDEIVKDVVRDDSEVSDGAVFVALRGENNNGHSFVGRAIENGAVCCIVNRDEGGFGDLPYIEVDDTYKALRDIAEYYRGKFNIPVVGITGSVGKTSTKGMIASVLSQEYNTLRTEKNYNNEVGVPLTLFRLSDDNEAAVVEMGMSDFGEISRLTKITKPDTAVITNIGVSHIENLGTQKGIRKAKLEILEGLPMDGTVILNGDDDLLWELNGTLDYETLYFGIDRKSCDLVAKNIRLFSCGSEFDVRIDGRDYKFETNVPGIHHIYNALAAILVGYKYNLKPESMIKGVHDFKTEGMRQNTKVYDKYTVISDCYNACPDSMQSGLDVLMLSGSDEGGTVRHVACLADMLELGDASAERHREVGKMCAEKGIDCLITIGEMAKYIARSAEENGMNPSDIYVYDNNDAAKAGLRTVIRDGDIIWVKGSRGMHLEEIVNWLDENASAAQ